MSKIIGITGLKDVGKTYYASLIIKLLVKSGYKIGSIKHAHHDFDIDKPGKDSFNHMKSGSNEVLIFNERKWAMISSLQQEEIPLEEVVKKFSKEQSFEIVIHEYEDADHGFNCEDRKSYNKVASLSALERSLNFIEKKND